jgi:hypothetical protein
LLIHQKDPHSVIQTNFVQKKSGRKSVFLNYENQTTASLLSGKYFSTKQKRLLDNVPAAA